MLIDWFTVAAQVLNFLILVWLMKRFLYQPVLDAIDAREQRIARELADAAAKQAEAGEERDAFAQRNLDFDQQRAALLAKATAQIASERARLLAAARAAADALLASRQQKLLGEAENLKQAIQRQTRKEVFAVARMALADLASADLEACASTEFIRRLHLLDDDDKRRFVSALASTPDTARVRSAFALPAAQRDAIQQAVRELLASDRPLHFDTADELMGGIELSVNGQRVAWTIDAYLTALEADVNQLLRAHAPPRDSDANAKALADGVAAQ